MTRAERRYFVLFALSVFIAWSPFKWMGYLMPLCVVAAGALFDRRILKRSLVLISGFALWALFTMLFASLLGERFLIQNAVLAFVTYSSFYPVLVFPEKDLSEKVYNRMARLSFLVLVVEATIGYFQLFSEFVRRGMLDLDVGDVVEGTIDLSLRNAYGFETKIFAMNMGLGMLLIAPYLMRKNARLGWFWIAYFGGIFIGTSVMHLLFSLGVAILLAALISAWRAGIERGMKQIAGVVTVVSLTVSLTAWAVASLMPVNVRLAGKMVNMLRENPKVLLLLEVGERHPMRLALGFGPGQGVSRAALLATGAYLSGVDLSRLPYIQPVMEDVQETAVVLLSSPLSRNSILRPTSSWLGWFTETGFLGSVGMLIVIMWLLFRRYIARAPVDPVVFRASILFLFIAGFFEFYWEYPQAILPGLLLLKALKSSRLL